MTDMKELSSIKSFGGQQKVFSHTSSVCNCLMKFAVYIPPAVIDKTISKVPVVYFLGGLGTLVEHLVNVVGYQEPAAKHNLVIVTPDSSPRDTGLPGETGSGHLQFYGHGAGMYMDSVTPGWKDHYNMFSYVTQELIQLVETKFDFVLAGKRGIAGESMGGHGTLLCALKTPELYMSATALYPVANASDNDGIKLAPYEKYLGTDKELWKQWDAYEVMKSYQGRLQDILVYIGTRDHLWKDLKVWQLVKAAQGKDNINLDLKVRAGYGHNYEFVKTIIDDVIKYHADILNK